MNIITKGSLFGLIFLVLFFIPNLIHYIRRPGERAGTGNKAMKVLKWLGGAGSLIFSVFWFASRKWGFYSITEFLYYWLGSMVLILVNWILWAVYFFKTRSPRDSAKGGATSLFVVRKKKVQATSLFVAGKRQVRFYTGLRMALAVLPVLLFLLHGITQRYLPLLASGILFAIGHIYVTCEHIRSGTVKNG